MIEAVMGTEPIHAGTIILHNSDITRLSVRARREAGIGYVPQDRHHEGLLLEAPLWENAALGYQTKAPFSRGIWFDSAGTRERTEKIREEFDVRTPDIDVSAHALSGGNQQKLIIGREMASEPELLVAAPPHPRYRRRCPGSGVGKISARPVGPAWQHSLSRLILRS